MNLAYIFNNRVSSWCNPATGDPIFVNFGFFRLIQSQNTHIPPLLRHFISYLNQ